MRKGHVFVIDDDRVLCESIGNLLTFYGYQVMTWTEPARFIEEVPPHRPAVVLTDMGMPEVNGLALHESLLQQGLAVPVVYISGETSVQQAITAMKMGALNFLLKPFTSESLLEAIDKGIEQDRARVDAIAQQARFDDTLALLSPRERQVYGLLLKGMSNPEIMEALHLAMPTVKQYKYEVMRKLEVRSFAELLEKSRVQPASQLEN